jgi:hypothetical protein
MGRMIEFGKGFHPEFIGWLTEDNRGVFISFIDSKDKGRGNFSKLLDELKEKYDWIKIPSPSNDMVEITARKGFRLVQEFFPEPFGEMGDVMVWKKGD